MDDEVAFKALFDQYHHVLFRNVMRLLSSEEEARDVVQEVFITLWEKRGGLDIERPVNGWLFTLSYNRAVNHIKMKLRRELRERSFPLANEVPDDSVVLADLQWTLVEKAVQQLSPQKRKVFELCRLQGKTYEAAALEMGISKHTVSEYLQQAMAFVRTYIKENPVYGGTLSILTVELFFR